MTRPLQYILGIIAVGVGTGMVLRAGCSLNVKGMIPNWVVLASLCATALLVLAFALFLGHMDARQARIDDEAGC